MHIKCPRFAKLVNDQTKFYICHSMFILFRYLYAQLLCMRIAHDYENSFCFVLRVKTLNDLLSKLSSLSKGL